MFSSLIIQDLNLNQILLSHFHDAQDIMKQDYSPFLDMKLKYSRKCHSNDDVVLTHYRCLSFSFLKPLHEL
jgi:hypothetical protein